MDICILYVLVPFWIVLVSSISLPNVPNTPWGDWSSVGSQQRCFANDATANPAWEPAAWKDGPRIKKRKLDRVTHVRDSCSRTHWLLHDGFDGYLMVDGRWWSYFWFIWWSKHDLGAESSTGAGLQRRSWPLPLRHPWRCEHQVDQWTLLRRDRDYACCWLQSIVY